MTLRFPKSIVMCLFLNIVLAFTQVVHASGYGIKFVQSNKTITFEGNISEHEWSFNFIDNQFCAKLKTIHIKECSTMVGRYMGFPKTDNYLLSTEDMNKNKIQGDSIIICIDQNENPGSIKIENTLHLTSSNYVHEFEISDFKFIHDSNIQVNSIKKDYLPNRPSILLRLSNDTNGLKYSNCSICVNNSNNWTIQSETDWKNVGSDTWRGYFRYFSVNPNQRDRHGVIYSYVFKQFQLILPPPDMPEKVTGISVYAKSTKKPGKLEFFVNHKSDQSTNFPYCIPFKKKNFRFKNKSDKVQKIKYDHSKDSIFSPRPSILLIIEDQAVSISSKYQNQPSARFNTKNKSSDIWNQIDISTFDNNEYEILSDIYEHNISKGFYCTLQDFTFDRSRKKYLSMSNWHNRYKRKLVYDQNDPFNSTFYIQLISEHRNNHRKEFFI